MHTFGCLVTCEELDIWAKIALKTRFLCIVNQLSTVTNLCHFLLYLEGKYLIFLPEYVYYFIWQVWVPFYSCCHYYDKHWHTLYYLNLLKYCFIVHHILLTHTLNKNCWHMLYIIAHYILCAQNILLIYWNEGSKNLYFFDISFSDDPDFILRYIFGS